MIRRDREGRVVESRRYMDTRVGGELLLGDGWEAVAHAELKRLALQIGIYHQQLKGCAGYEETGAAIEALDEACNALEQSNFSD